MATGTRCQNRAWQLDLQAARDGELSFDRLIKRNHALINRMVRKYYWCPVGHGSSEDILQLAYMGIAEALKTWATEGPSNKAPLHLWTRDQMRFHIHRHLSKLQKQDVQQESAALFLNHQVVSERIVKKQGGGYEPATTETPETLYEARERAQAALRALPERQSQIVSGYMAGLPLEVAVRAAYPDRPVCLRLAGRRALAAAVRLVSDVATQ